MRYILGLLGKIFKEPSFHFQPKSSVANEKQGLWKQSIKIQVTNILCYMPILIILSHIANEEQGLWKQSQKIQLSDVLCYKSILIISPYIIYIEKNAKQYENNIDFVFEKKKKIHALIRILTQVFNSGC